jgi:hypothetical protein
MNKIISINSENSNNANNFSVVVPPFHIAPFSQVCLTHFVGSNKAVVNIDNNNNTIVWTTGRTQSSTVAVKGLRPCTATIKSGQYRVDGTANLGSIAYAVAEALNNSEGMPFRYKSGWTVTETAGVLTIKLDTIDVVRADGALDILSTINGLENPVVDDRAASGAVGDDFEYVNNVVGVDTSNNVTSGVIKRSVISNSACCLYSSTTANMGATQAGMEFEFEVPTGLDPTEFINGYFGVMRQDSQHSENGQNASFYIDKRDVGGTKNAVDTNGAALSPANLPIVNDSNYFFHCGFYVGNDGYVYTFNASNDDNAMKFTKTATQLVIDGANDRDIIFTIRGYWDTNEFKLRLGISQEQTGQPRNFVALETYGQQSQAISFKYNTFWIDGTNGGNVTCKLNGDYFIASNLKVADNVDIDEGHLTMFWNRPTQADLEKFAIDLFTNEIGKANFSNTWHVDTLRFTQGYTSSIAQTAASYGTGVDTGNMENSPVKKLYMINCPSLPINSMVCNATNRNLISSIGIYEHGYDNQCGFENWISIDNPVEISISNLQFYISDVYGNPCNDFENNVSFIIKFRHEPHKIQTSIVREQSQIIAELRRKTAQTRENIAIDQQIDVPN